MVELGAIGAPAFTVEVSADGGFRYASANAAQLARAGLAAGALVGRSPDAVHAPPVAARLCRAYRDCVQKRALVEHDAYGEEPGAGAAWRTWLMPLFGADGAVTGVLGISHGLGEVRPPDQDWKAEAEHLATALRSLNGAEWHREGVDGPIVASDGFALLMGEAAPRPVAWDEWRERVHPEDRDAAFGEHGGGVRRYRFSGRGGSPRWARCTRVAVRDGDGRITGLSGAVIDVTDEHDREERLRNLAMRDALTGLLNRRGFRHALYGATSAWPPDAVVALFMVDLDDFKATNDTFGHAAGDAVLAEAARRLAGVMGEGALCSRLGGDEFIAVRAVADGAEARALRDALAAAFSARLSPSGPSLIASIGLSVGDGAPDVPSLMAAADAQLYASKAERPRTARAA